MAAVLEAIVNDMLRTLLMPCFKNCWATLESSLRHALADLALADSHAFRTAKGTLNFYRISPTRCPGTNVVPSDVGLMK